jgi:hypothetical protein
MTFLEDFYEYILHINISFVFKTISLIFALINVDIN